MTDMAFNCRCSVCGLAGRRGIEVVVYNLDGQLLPLCEDDALQIEADGQELFRIANQDGGKATMEAA